MIFTNRAGCSIRVSYLALGQDAEFMARLDFISLEFGPT